MILVLAIRFFYFILYQAVKIFGSFVINAIVDAILARLDEFTMEMAKKSQPIVIVQ